MQEWVVVYQYPPARIATQSVAGGVTAVVKPKRSRTWVRGLGFMLLAVALGGFFGPFIPMLRMESSYALAQVAPAVTPTPAPAVTTNEFNLIIPKIGVNAPVIGDVDPTKPQTYDAALLQGVAHSSTSYFPDQDGTVYLFSHSTNYDWFVKDLNAVFYLLKNLEPGDTAQIQYHGKEYTYTIREKKIVSPRDISYLVPVAGKKGLILETCWPPGSTAERLLVLADPASPAGRR